MKHNGYKIGRDEWLPGALGFLRSIPLADVVIILTAREPEAREQTEQFFAEEGVRVSQMVFGLPNGERILVNDTKPSGLQCAFAINQKRDSGVLDLNFPIDPRL